MAVSAPTHASPEFFLPVLCTIFFPSHWLLSHITSAETMDCCEGGMNPVSMTIINPPKEYWSSRKNVCRRQYKWDSTTEVCI